MDAGQTNPPPAPIVWSRIFELVHGKPDEQNRLTIEDIGEALRSGLPVHIEGAVLPGMVFGPGQIARELRILKCEVRGPFVATNLVCAESLILDGTTFKGGLNLSGTRVNGTLQTNCIRCEKLDSSNGTGSPGKAEFAGTVVEGRWASDNAVFADGFNSEYATLRGAVSFQFCRFEGGETSFGLATYEHLADFHGASFDVHGVNFTAANVRGHLLLNSVRSAGDVSLVLCRIGGTLQTNNCRIRKDLRFAHAVLSSSWLMKGTIVHGSLACNFLSAGIVVIDGCRFGRDVDFANASLAGFSLIRSTIMRSAAFRFESAVVQGEFELNHCKLGGAFLLGATSLGQLTIGQPLDPFKDEFARIDKADVIFLGNAYLGELKVNGSLTCYRAMFLGTCSFEETQVHGTCDITLCRFGFDEDKAREWRLHPSKARRLLARQNELAPVEDGKSTVKFNRARFRGRVGLLSLFHRPVALHGVSCTGSLRFLSGCRFDNDVEFYFAHLGDEANLGGATFNGNLDLRNARFIRALKFDLLRPPARARFAGSGRVHLGECSYASLQSLPRWSSAPPGANKSQERDDLLTFLNQIDGGRSAFIFLEQYYRQAGETDKADDVRRHWRRDVGSKKPWWAKPWDALLRWTTGYGTRVAPLLVGLLLIGALEMITEVRYAMQEARVAHFSGTLLSAQLKTAEIAFRALLTLGVALLGDAFRRGIWPEKS